MTTIITLLTIGLLSMIAYGIYLHHYPLAPGRARKLLKPTLTTNLVLFFGAQIAVTILGVQQALAAPGVQNALADTANVSTGLGLAFIGIAIPTAFSTVGAGLAVGPIGAASLAAVSEKSEMFGRTLVYLGLAEGIAIYGLVLSILLLNRI
jgi:V/A-type H+-transporting ATPase subunit K